MASFGGRERVAACPGRIGHSRRSLAVALFAALILAAPADRADALPGNHPVVSLPAIRGQVYSVAAVSANSVWAVGNTLSSPMRTLIVHWNGSAWTRVASPSPCATHDCTLNAVAASSARNAWAVGEIGTNGLGSTLI